MKKSPISLFTLFIMVFMLMPSAVNAETRNGTCGQNLTWVFENGKLTISGTGLMSSWGTASKGSYGDPPWESFGAEIREVEICDGVTDIGNFAFYASGRYVNLEKVTIADTVTRIGQCAFRSCSKLKNISIPQNACVDQYAFADCDALTEVDIYDYVYNYAFYSCSNLKKVTLGPNVRSVGDQAFAFCNNITDVVILGKNLYIGSSTSFPSYSIEHVYYVGTEEEWRNNTTWANLETDEWIYDYVPPVSGNCGDNLIWSFENGKLVVSGTGDMYGWSYFGEVPWYHLKEEIDTVVLEDGVMSIGSMAFHLCPSLKDIVMYDSIKNIAENTFEISSNINFVVESDSYAQKYAKAHNIPFKGFLEFIAKWSENGAANLVTRTNLADYTDVEDFGTMFIPKSIYDTKPESAVEAEYDNSNNVLTQGDTFKGTLDQVPVDWYSKGFVARSYVDMKSGKRIWSDVCEFIINTIVTLVD